MPYGPLDPSTAEAAPTTNIGAPTQNFGMELQEFQEELVAQLQGRTDIQPGNDMTRVNRWINWAYVNVAGMIDLKELWASIEMPTVADQPLYLLPEQVAWIKQVTIQDSTISILRGGWPLDQIDEPTYRTLPESDEIDVSPLYPTKWFRYGRLLVEYPTPDDVYALVVDCRIRPLPLTDANDCPLIPTEFHEAITMGALERACRALQLWDRAAQYKNAKVSLIREIINTDAEERDTMFMGFQPITSRNQLYANPFED